MALRVILPILFYSLYIRVAKEIRVKNSDDNDRRSIRNRGIGRRRAGGEKVEDEEKSRDDNAAYNGK